MQALKPQNLIKLISVPLFTDNYCYFIQSETQQNKAALVDPADPPQVMQFLKNNFQNHIITHVLYTHKHWDHAGNSSELHKSLKEHQQESVEFIASEIDGANIEYITKKLQNEEIFQVLDFNVKAMVVPCHTKGHTLYYFDAISSNNKDNNQLESDTFNEKFSQFKTNRCIFTGDTLFIGGVGRFFEGDGIQMSDNFDRISQLPDNTHVFCGHEYTKDNYKWAIGVDHENENLKARYEWSLSQKITIPSTIEEEKKTNVFMRCRDEKIQQYFGLNDPQQVMTALREMKNNNKQFVTK